MNSFFLTNQYQNQQNNLELTLKSKEELLRKAQEDTGIFFLNKTSEYFYF